MTKYRAKCASYGVNGRYWQPEDEGEITPEEVKKIPKAYFNQLFEKVEVLTEEKPDTKTGSDS